MSTSENLKQILDKYPLFMVRNNTNLLFESIGALKTLQTYFPSLDAKCEIQDEINLRLQFAHETLLINEYNWNLIPAWNNLTMEEFTRFVADGEANGYEFRVTNSRVYYRVHQTTTTSDNPYQE